jgi:hypothetical protein
MEITRDVILDLLPLYLAGEVSSDTRALVEHYMENDPQLANIAEKSKAAELARDIPVPLTKEDEMEAYRKTKRLIFLSTVILAAVIGAIPLIALVVFFLSSS